MEKRPKTQIWKNVDLVVSLLAGVLSGLITFSGGGEMGLRFDGGLARHITTAMVEVTNNGGDGGGDRERRRQWCIVDDDLLLFCVDNNSPLFVLRPVFFFEADFAAIFLLDFGDETVVMGSIILGLEVTELGLSAGFFSLEIETSILNFMVM
ncbi:transmembrane protein, putative [Medicago truncatula]|uniref:Transmembrane protein, putative n=1 Tax=Medicago truncatula TaxID=3880 RepID=A0A072U168_MEDTR|nr:transmembrane protein, putative [Medicago truncatula]